MMAEFNIDCKGMQCPGPIVEVFKKINSMESGDVLHIEVSDHGFHSDIQAWCGKTGNELVKLEDNGDMIAASIRKA